jgi:hypothetical protein
LHFGRGSQVCLREPLGKVPETLQEIGANVGEDNFRVYEVKQGWLARKRYSGKGQKIPDF